MFEPSISVKKKKTQVHEFGLFTFFFCLTVNATQHGSIKKKKKHDISSISKNSNNQR
jgi:hypothetical protein